MMMSIEEKWRLWKVWNDFKLHHPGYYDKGVFSDKLFSWDEATRWRRCGFTGRWLLNMVGLVLGEGPSLLPMT